MWVTVLDRRSPHKYNAYAIRLKGRMPVVCLFWTCRFRKNTDVVRGIGMIPTLPDRDKGIEDGGGQPRYIRCLDSVVALFSYSRISGKDLVNYLKRKTIDKYIGYDLIYKSVCLMQRSVIMC